jgi:hypothetical protein
MKFGSILVLAVLMSSADAQVRGNKQRRRRAVSESKFVDLTAEIPESGMDRIKQRYLKKIPAVRQQGGIPVSREENLVPKVVSKKKSHGNGGKDSRPTPTIPERIGEDNPERIGEDSPERIGEDSPEIENKGLIPPDSPDSDRRNAPTNMSMSMSMSMSMPMSMSMSMSMSMRM